MYRAYVNCRACASTLLPENIFAIIDGLLAYCWTSAICSLASNHLPKNSATSCASLPISIAFLIPAYAGQLQNGSKTLNLSIYNDNNEVWIKQRRNGAHSATINLYGSYGTDLYLNQAHNSVGQTYNLTQTCATIGGCSISVTQD